MSDPLSTVELPTDEQIMKNNNDSNNNNKHTLSASEASNSPLHMQLLLMMGACYNNEQIMNEAYNVQKLILSIQPTLDKPYTQKLSNKSNKKTKNSSSSESSSSSSSSTIISIPTDDTSIIWSSKSITSLLSSSDPNSHLILAMLYDPASPFHPHLHDINKSIQQYGLAAIKIPSTYACSRLAHFYMKGEYIQKDITKAAKWLRIGAIKGHALCQYQLAYLLEEGTIDGKKDIKQAVEWYEKSAKQKYPNAMYNLASILIEKHDDKNNEIVQDVYTAIRLMEDAAALGDLSSQLKLGHLCFMGSDELDIEADINKTIYYLTLAANNSNEQSKDAAKILGIIYSTPSNNSMHNPNYDLEKSIKYLRIAAQNDQDQDSKILLQRQLAKYEKIKKGMVIDNNSKHVEALKLLSLQEGKNNQVVMATVIDEANNNNSSIDNSSEPSFTSTSTLSASTSSESNTTTPVLTVTPSTDTLLLALTRLHCRYPEYGPSKLHTLIKQEYQHWAVSEKRVKKLYQEQQWNDTINTIPANTNSLSTPIPAIVLSDSSTVKQNLQHRTIVNDLD